VSGDPDVPTATGDGWCGWSTPATGDGWPIGLTGITGDGWCPIQEGRRRGKRRPVYQAPVEAPPLTGPYAPEPWVDKPPLHLPADVSALMAALDREREQAEKVAVLAKAKRRAQNRRALEMLLMDE
jgi:hypothetical protein